jgi:hypothetical protein
MMKHPPPEHTKWKKGQSGNLNGRPKGRLSFGPAIEEELRAAIKDPNGNPIEVRQALVKTLIKEGLKGNMRALEFIIDKIDGKAKQSLQIEARENIDKEQLKRIAKAIADESE